MKSTYKHTQDEKWIEKHGAIIKEDPNFFHVYTLYGMWFAILLKWSNIGNSTFEYWIYLRKWEKWQQKKSRDIIKIKKHTCL